MPPTKDEEILSGRLILGNGDIDVLYLVAPSMDLHQVPHLLVHVRDLQLGPSTLWIRFSHAVLVSSA